MALRTSPVTMALPAGEVWDFNGWPVALTYQGELVHNDLFLVDLSHVPKWSLKDRNLSTWQPLGMKMPEKPGDVSREGDLVLARVSPGEARILALGEEAPVFNETNYTDVTDAYAALALVGHGCFRVLSKLSAVDLTRPEQTRPLSVEAPLADITCWLVALTGAEGIPGLIIAGARGYGEFLLEIIQDAGQAAGLQAAGWQRFRRWLL